MLVTVFSIDDVVSKKKKTIYRKNFPTSGTSKQPSVTSDPSRPFLSPSVSSYQLSSLSRIPCSFHFNLAFRTLLHPSHTRSSLMCLAPMLSTQGPCETQCGKTKFGFLSPCLNFPLHQGCRDWLEPQYQGWVDGDRCEEGVWIRLMMVQKATFMQMSIKGI